VEDKLAIAQFAKIYPDVIGQQPVSQLPWRLGYK